MKLIDMTEFANKPLDELLELVGQSGRFEGEAIYSIACREELGEEEQAVWLAQAAFHGFFQANLQLACYYMEHDEFFRAHYWLSRAEEEPGCREIMVMVKDAVGLMEKRTALMREAALCDEPEPLLEMAKCSEKLAQLVTREDPLELTKTLHLPTREEAAESAFRCYELAAEMGHFEACVKVGEYYQYGKFPVADLKKEQRERIAYSYYRFVATSGCREHLYRLAGCYAQGMGVKQSYAKAVRWYKLLVSKCRHAGAALDLALCYEYGRGVRRDLKLALYYSKRALQYGLAGAEVEVAYYQDKLDHYLPVEKHQRLAEQGDRSSQYELAQAYFHGYEVEKNLEQAFHWYSKAAKQGYTPAFLKLNLCYDKGYGVAANAEKAFLWWNRYTSAEDVSEYLITDDDANN